MDSPKGTAFTALEMPNGKWRLLRGVADMGFFESPAECESAIHRIIVKNVRYYDADGELID